MSVVLGQPTPSRLMIPSAGVAFPHSPATYTSADGSMIVPGGSLDRWFAWRRTGGTVRGEVIAYGDSTTFGSGGLYSWLQRIRDRGVGFGLPDGGKGMFVTLEDEIVYDAPEVNGIVTNNFTGVTDTWDAIGGGFFYDNGAVANRTLTLQFKGSCARLWYSKRPTNGSFTYNLDGAGAITVDAHTASGNPTPAFVYFSGLDPAATHTIVITNLASSGHEGCDIGLAPMYATGLSVQKFAVSGHTFSGFILPWRRWSALGLSEPTGDEKVAASYSVDTTPPLAGRVNPVLSVLHLGFNDLSTQANTDYSKYTDSIDIFAAMCQAASVDGVVVSGQLPYNANWPTYGAAVFTAMRDRAALHGLPFVDFFYPIGGPALDYAGGTANPHLTKPQYVTQADFVWDNLLGVN